LNEVETIGGYDKWFVLWPFYFNSRAGLGTTNPATSLTMIPFYSQTRSPSRDETSYGFPLGFNAIHDREKGYVEHDFLWPLFVKAHGSKTVTRYFPIYSRAEHNGIGKRFLRLLALQVQPPASAFFGSPPQPCPVLPLLRHGGAEHRIARLQTPRRFLALLQLSPRVGWNRRTQVLAILEPLFPNNRTMSREYSPLWALWRAEKNPRTGATSQSLLWNCTGAKALERQKKPRSCSVLFSINPGRTAAAGVFATSIWAGKRRGTPPPNRDVYKYRRNSNSVLANLAGLAAIVAAAAQSL
jgi:hypothetical protein